MSRSMINTLGNSVLGLWMLLGCSSGAAPSKQTQSSDPPQVLQANNTMNESTNMEKATLGAGCFWCVEAVYKEMKGVISVESGYSGGHVDNPTYKAVCAGTTGHAEVVQVTFDPAQTSYQEILEVFWRTHDPTTLNRQGNDVGTQYRSVIYYHNDEQKKIAEASKKAADEAGFYNDPIVTEISPFDKFYVAESYHQDYYENNPNQPYCRFVVGPKVDKFRKLFQDKLKEKN